MAHESPSHVICSKIWQVDLTRASFVRVKCQPCGDVTLHRAVLWWHALCIIFGPELNLKLVSVYFFQYRLVFPTCSCVRYQSVPRILAIFLRNESVSMQKYWDALQCLVIVRSLA